MKNINFYLIFFFIFIFTNSYAKNNVTFVDIDYLLNNSTIGKQTINKLTKYYNSFEKHLEPFNSLKLVKVDVKNNEIPLSVQIQTKYRSKIHSILKKNKIETRKLGPCLSESNLFIKKGNLKNSKYFSENVLCLPSGPDQDKNLPIKIAKILKENNIH